MKKTILLLAMATTVGLGTLTAAPPQAHAQWWIAPAVVGGALLGVGIGAAAANPCNYCGYAYGPAYVYAPAYAYSYVPTYAYVPPPGYVYAPNIAYAQPSCRYLRTRYHGYWHRVRTCY